MTAHPCFTITIKTPSCENQVVNLVNMPMWCVFFKYDTQYRMRESSPWLCISTLDQCVQSGPITVSKTRNPTAWVSYVMLHENRKMKSYGKVTKAQRQTHQPNKWSSEQKKWQYCTFTDLSAIFLSLIQSTSFIVCVAKGRE